MTADLVIRIGPLIGGVILMAICMVAILRNPAVSNVFAGLLAFGGLLFVIPALAFFNFKGLGIELSGQAATTGQVSEQAAGINARLEDIKIALADLGRKVSPSAPAPAAPSPEFGANRNSTVIVVYPSDPKLKTLAKQMENDLLKKGYLATSVFSDYSELSDAKKGTPGSVRFVFTDPAKATLVKQLLKPQTTGLTLLQDDQRQQMSADVQILLF
jgi:hypothetical protein